MLNINLLSKVSTFALMGFFASVVITPCFAMEPEDEKPASASPVMKEEEKPAVAPQLPKKTSAELDKERQEAIQEKVSSIRKASEEKIAPLVQQINQIRKECIEQPNYLEALMKAQKEAFEKLMNAQKEALNKQKAAEQQVAALNRQINDIQKEREAALKPFFPEISKTRAQNFMNGHYKDKNLSEDDEGLSILTGLPTLKKGNRFLKAAYTYIFKQGAKIEDPSRRRQFLKQNFFVDMNSQTRQFRLNALKEFFIGLMEEHADHMQQYVMGMECDGVLKREIKEAFEKEEVRIRRGDIQTLLPCLHLFTKVRFIG